MATLDLENGTGPLLLEDGTALELEDYPPPAAASWGTFSEQFNATPADSTLSGVTVSNGKLNLPRDGNYGYYRPNTPRSIKDAELVMDSAHAMVDAGFGDEFFFNLQATNPITAAGSAGGPQAYVSGEYLTFRWYSGGAVSTNVGVLFNATSHRYWKMKHKTGVGFTWETSPDGTTWTVQRTLATVPSWIDSLLYLQLHAGNYNGLSTDNTTVESVVGASVAPPVSASDDFNRADQALSASGQWVTAGTGPPTIAGNQVVGGTSASSARHTQAFTGRLSSQVTHRSGLFSGVAVAMPAFAAGSTVAALGTYYVFRQQGTGAGVHIAQKDLGAATHTTLASSTQNLASGDKLRLDYDGTTLRGYINNVEVLTHVPASPISTTANPHVGIAHGSTTQTGAALFDDWTGGLLVDVVTARRFWADDSPINKLIPANPTLDPNSASIASYLDGGGTNRPKISTVAYGVAIYYADSNTPRYTIANTAGATSTLRVTYDPSPWGANSEIGRTIPIDPTWRPTPGYPEDTFEPDLAAAIVDTDGRVYGLWGWEPGGTADNPGSVRWMGSQMSRTTDKVIGGDQSTGSGFSRLAGIVRRDELQVGKIKHALVAASRLIRPNQVVFPATKTDGKYLIGGAAAATALNSIPEAQLFQLNPALDLAAIAGITELELMLGKAAQDYGVYPIDNGGADTFSVIMERPPVGTYAHTGNYNYSITDPVYNALGVMNETPDLSHIPWEGNLRVLHVDQALEVSSSSVGSGFFISM